MQRAVNVKRASSSAGTAWRRRYCSTSTANSACLLDVPVHLPCSNSRLRMAAISSMAVGSKGNDWMAANTASVTDSSRGNVECDPEPGAGVVVAEQQFLLRTEVTVEGPQRDTRVGRDLLSRGLVDALGQEAHLRGVAEGLACALRAERGACGIGQPTDGWPRPSGCA